jgi:leucyl aminopeptidase (aminopeptidase T)
LSRILLGAGRWTRGGPGSATCSDRQRECAPETGGGPTGPVLGDRDRSRCNRRPISKGGLLFFNTLFDENAACHVAVGQCYSQCFVGGETLTPDEIAARGGNQSIIHIDWMIGWGAIDVEGLDAHGGGTSVFRKGECA